MKHLFVDAPSFRAFPFSGLFFFRGLSCYEMERGFKEHAALEFFFLHPNDFGFPFPLSSYGTRLGYGFPFRFFLDLTSDRGFIKEEPILFCAVIRSIRGICLVTKRTVCRIIPPCTSAFLMQSVFRRFVISYTGCPACLLLAFLTVEIQYFPV